MSRLARAALRFRVPLNEGVGVADKFLKKGQVIVSHRGRSSPNRDYRAEHGKR